MPRQVQHRENLVWGHPEKRKNHKFKKNGAPFTRYLSWERFSRTNGSQDGAPNRLNSMKKYIKKLFKNNRLRDTCFPLIWNDLGRVSEGLGTAKPSIPSNTSFKILKVVRCNFGPLKTRLQIGLLNDFRSKLGSKIEPKSS